MIPFGGLNFILGSTIIAQSAQVPTIPWSGDGLTVNYKENGLCDEVYNRACVETPEEALASANRIGFPVMIKVKLAFFFSCIIVTSEGKREGYTFIISQTQYYYYFYKIK